MDGRTHGRMMEGKTICPPPLRGGGIRASLWCATSQDKYSNKQANLGLAHESNRLLDVNGKQGGP